MRGALRRVYLAIISRLSRRQAKRLQAVVMALRPRARRRAAALAALTPEVRLMCIAWGVDRTRLEAIRDQMFEIGGRKPERMLVVSDCDALFGKGGCQFEYIPSREEWSARFDPDRYDRFVAGRIDEIVEVFRARRVVAIGEVPEPLLYGLAGRTPSEDGPETPELSGGAEQDSRRPELEAGPAESGTQP